ncbi:related to 1-acyldihydroxyacetone-phosphate reductase [Phialocephala subalpina]|uniref:Related to 1-acyldihydroxyacetone-phosphate reductase n=1 Tax=Phialocephala subalpina TaxID=576137 RepID=A0A1L7WCH2_9HELO|nr:related to 1-acyldihydroxyacetone-phosphate reductase [Phialocephala subalpina]
MPAVTAKTVLITGCSEGGLGAALANAFAQKGFTYLRPFKFPRKLSRTGGALDVLVNNAGSMLKGPLLDVLIQEIRKAFEINVWAMLAVTQAFAPLVVKSKGVILNICSIAGAVRMAWQGTYNASKVAETWFSETLRIGMEPLSVCVLTATVGEAETNIYQIGEPPELPKGSYYLSVRQYIVDQAAGKLQKSNEPAEVTAQNLVKDVLSGKSGQTWRGGVAGTAKLASWLPPTRIFERLLHSNRGVYTITLPL